MRIFATGYCIFSGHSFSKTCSSTTSLLKTPNDRKENNKHILHSFRCMNLIFLNKLKSSPTQNRRHYDLAQPCRGYQPRELQEAFLKKMFFQS